TDDDHTQLIMVTNNIVYGWRPGVNVHLIDSKRWPETFASAGSFTSDHIGAEGQPLPWRFCARATGDQVSAKAWSVHSPEPAWGDPSAAFTVTVPPEFVNAGQPGVYAGHLRAGQSSSYEQHSGAVLG